MTMERMDIPITIRAKDEASATMNKVSKSADGMNRKFKESGKSANTAGLGMMGLSRGMGMASKAMGPLAAAVGVMSAFKFFGNFQKNAANVEFTLKSLPDEARKSFESFGDNFKYLRGIQTEFTGQELEKMFVGLQKESLRYNITMKEMAGTMALARIFGMDLAQVTTMVGQAMRGNIDPLRQLTGEAGFTGLDKVLKDAIETEVDMLPGIDSITGAFKNATEAIVGTIDAITKGNWEEAGDFMMDVPFLGGFTPNQAIVIADKIANFLGLSLRTAAPDVFAGFMGAFNEGFTGIEPGSMASVVRAMEDGLIDEETGEVLGQALMAGAAKAEIWSQLLSHISKTLRDQGVIGAGQYVTGISNRTAGVVQRVFASSAGDVRDVLAGRDPAPVAKGGGALAGVEFQRGGIVPGSGPRAIVAHGGEGIFTQEQMRAVGLAGGGGAQSNIMIGQLIVDDELRQRATMREMQRLLTENSRRGVGI